jgi:hypothetical protein
MIVTGINDDIKLNQIDNDFVNMINDRINCFGMIPYTVPRKLIVLMIQQSARTFYRYGYYRSQEQRLMLLPKSEIMKYAPKEGSQIKDVGYRVQLPKNISIIQEIYETNISERTILQDEELEKNILFDSTSYGQNIYGINNNMFMFDMAAKMIQYTAVRTIFGRKIMFKYIQSTYQLIFYETNFNDALILDCFINLNVEVLYDDDLFVRHVIASVKQELKRIIGGHTATLPGDVTLNVDEICNDLEDKATVEEILKNSAGVGDIIMMR